MIAIVTGASSGIGKALYEGLKRDHPDGKIIGISRRGPDCCIDITQAKPLSIPLLIHPAKTVDLLVNCAGVMPFEESREVFDVNFWGTFYMIEEVFPLFKADGKSCIVNIASVSGMIAEPELPIYAASKAAVISLTKSLARKFAPFVRVNCISPGFYNTNLVNGPTPEELIQQVPMGYESYPEELSSVLEMIYSTKYMTGANIVVDGGKVC